MHFGIALRNVGYETGVGPLEANGLRIGDVVGNMPQRARLGAHAAQRGVH